MFSKSSHLYDAIYSFKDYAAEAAKVTELVKARQPNARTLLDVACGTGKHLEQLKDEFEVEGLDLDEGLLEIARTRLPGAPVHHADMIDFTLPRRFDVVTCLFSSIGYVMTARNLDAAISRMADHLNDGGVLLVEPWIFPENWQEGAPHALLVNEPDLKICRANVSGRDGDVSKLELHYLIATPKGVDYFTENHDMGLFDHGQYSQAFEQAGLKPHLDPQGLTGRGLYVGYRS